MFLNVDVDFQSLTRPIVNVLVKQQIDVYVLSTNGLLSNIQRTETHHAVEFDQAITGSNTFVHRACDTKGKTANLFLDWPLQATRLTDGSHIARIAKLS